MSAYEMVIGLETHVELRTRTKAFCACPNEYGAPPNTRVCPVCLGLPGTLPSPSAQAVRLSALAGLALGCRVHERSRFDRKNYFYPDLPKGYQITQFYHPLCEDGYVEIRTEKGGKRIGITRIHMEEDAGKLIHQQDGILLDMNRCGVPLIEIVTEPDIRSAAEAVAYLRKLRAILTYTGVSDCRMNEGSLRCDVNLSLRRPGQPMGTRTEIKNLNSFQSVERAIWAEYARQAALLDAGESVVQETRRFDQKTGLTYGMRRKENSADYRYFPEPDLPEVFLPPQELEALRRLLPMLPDERCALYGRRFGLKPEEAELIASERWLAEYFEEAAGLSRNPAALARLIVGEAFAQIAARDTARTGERGADSLPIAPAHLAQLSDMAADGRVNSTTAKKILSALFDHDCDPETYARENSLFLITDPTVLRRAARQAVRENSAMVQAYLGGKTNARKALMGKAMALTQGRADPCLLAGQVELALRQEERK